MNNFADAAVEDARLGGGLHKCDQRWFNMSGGDHADVSDVDNGFCARDTAQGACHLGRTRLYALDDGRSTRSAAIGQGLCFSEHMFTVCRRPLIQGAALHLHGSAARGLLDSLPRLRDASDPGHALAGV